MVSGVSFNLVVIETSVDPGPIEKEQYLHPPPY